MEWLKVLASARAWEIVVSLVGGYLAAKNLETQSRQQFLITLIVAVVIGFAAVNFFLPWGVELKYLSDQSAANLKPFAILIMSALSLRAIDILYGWAAQLGAFKLRDFKLGFFKGKE